MKWAALAVALLLVGCAERDMSERTGVDGDGSDWHLVAGMGERQPVSGFSDSIRTSGHILGTGLYKSDI